MKALIVEDELLARVGMRSLINWEEMGISLLEDAQDGREALKRIETEQPDIILLDLNIPEISGLELLKIIRGRHLPIKTVVVSCYDDFDTVKEAMKLGAVDYIRKLGLSREELTAALSNLTELPAHTEKSAAQTGYEIREKVQNIPEDFQNGCCLSVYMLSKYAEELEDMKIIETLACQYYQNLGRSFMCLGYEGKLLILMKEETNEEEAEELLRQISPFVDNRCYLGITSYRNQDHRSRFFVRIANSIENYGFFGGKSQVIRLDLPIEIKKECPFDLGPYMARLERGIQKISEEEILAVLEELFDAVSGCRNLSVTLVKRMMIEMLSRFSDKAGQLGGALEDIEVNDSYKHYQKIVHTTSFEELKAWWRAFVRQFTAQFFTRQKRSESDLIENTLEYIEQNLDKTIQLADVARHVGGSEPYLSSFFKKTMNENFIPYVNRQKMRRAKQLFAEGKMVYQVSDILGYENSTYFSKVFKKVEGITPEQYRKNLQS